MSYKCKLTFLRTQDSTTKSDFEINYSFSYHLGQEETYKGEKKKASIRKHCLLSSRLSLCFYTKSHNTEVMRILQRT